MSALKIFRDRVSKLGIFGLFSAFVGVVVGLDYIYKEYLTNGAEPTDAIIWAFTAAFGFLMIFGLLNYCVYAQGILQDEVDRVSKVKSQLENSILHNRKSSARKGRNK